jgi:hypothetical protein
MYANLAVSPAVQPPSPCRCFWGLELAFQRVSGVVKTTVGYTGGQQAHPSYEEVCMGITGHAEVVQVAYDPDQVRVCACSRSSGRLRGAKRLGVGQAEAAGGIRPRPGEGVWDEVRVCVPVTQELS